MRGLELLSGIDSYGARIYAREREVRGQTRKYDIITTTIYDSRFSYEYVIYMVSYSSPTEKHESRKFMYTANVCDVNYEI